MSKTLELDATRINKPKKKIDPDELLALATRFATNEEIASVLGCSSDTLTRRFADILKKGREFAKLSLRSKQYELAMQGNVTMLVWLGKQYLGQADRFTTSEEDGRGFAFIKS